MTEAKEGWMKQLPLLRWTGLCRTPDPLFNTCPCPWNWPIWVRQCWLLHLLLGHWPSAFPAALKNVLCRYSSRSAFSLLLMSLQRRLYSTRSFLSRFIWRLFSKSVFVPSEICLVWWFSHGISALLPCHSEIIHQSVIINRDDAHWFPSSSMIFWKISFVKSGLLLSLFGEC